jgi:undecaprenyl-diphosphatase
MGLVQGATEWLPISSSGHLVMAQHLFSVTERTLFDAILHIGTLLAALVYFRKDIKPLLNLKEPMFRKIIIASIPIIVIGFLLNDVIDAAFSFILLVAVFLIINGCVLFLNIFVKQAKPDQENNSTKNFDISLKNTIIIGIFQVFALFPGISRSGTTITTGRILGVSWYTAAKFSFFISFLPLAGAAVFKFATAYNEFEPLYIIGFIVAFIVGYATIDLMMMILRRGKFHYFGIYTILLGIGMIAAYYLV